MILLAFIWPFVCAVANRIRGGWLMNVIKEIIPFWSTTPARIFVSFIISIPVFVSTYTQFTFKEAVVFWILLYIGFIWRWSPWNTMNEPLKDVLCLTLRGWVLTFPAGRYLELHDFASCGLLMGIIYYIPYRFPLHYTDCTGYTWDASDWGELFFGFILGLFICLNCIQNM